MARENKHPRQGHTFVVDSLLNPSPIDHSLTPAIKSYGFSLIVHATLVAALYVIPASTQQRFASNGQTQVIAIEATQNNASPASTVSITMQTTPLASMLDSDIDRIVPAELFHDVLAIDSMERPETMREESPKLRVPPIIPNVQIDRQLAIQRREFVQPRPDVVVTVEPPRPRTPRPMSPPAGAAIPTEEFVGLKKSESADMSKNRPPAYPLEAVRRQLEGVVLLGLTIGVSGDVTRVDVIESSGHQVLDQAAMEAVASWKGKPAKRWGRPVESVERLPVRFRL